MKTKELISFLENFDENSEVEIEMYDMVSDEYLDSTYDIGIREEPTHPILTISSEHSSS